MNFGLSREHLTPVSGSVRAAIVSYDGRKPGHRAALRAALPRFLGKLGAVHGAAFPRTYLDAVMAVVDAKEIEVDFLLASYETGMPAKLIGLATGASTFDVAWDGNNKMRVFPVKHGEDLCVDETEALLFREYSRDPLNPNGTGAGSWFMREQIQRSTENPHWVFDGRDNEHALDNSPILGVMNKYGAVRGTVEDSAMMQLSAGLTMDMERRCGVNGVIIENLPEHGNGSGVSPHDFLTRWSSRDGRMQMAIVYKKIASTFNGEPVVWTKIRSNGLLPEGEMLKETLAALLSAGCREIASPERRWGAPRERLNDPNDISAIFGWPVPTMHLHTCKERPIIEALREMDAEYRTFGHEVMVSGRIRPKSLAQHKAVFGRELPDATAVSAIATAPEVHRPYFDISLDLSPMSFHR